jgi:hypothetical protein
MWVESDWPQGIPWLEMYLREAPATESATLGAGVAVTLAAVAASWVLRHRAHSRLA